MFKRIIPPIGLLFALLVIGCATPNDPVYPPVEFALSRVSLTQTPGLAQDVWVHENLAYVADDDQGVMVYDVSRLESPVLIDTLVTINSVVVVRYTPEYNLLTVSENRIAVYDLETEQIIHNAYQGNAADLYVAALEQQYLFIAEIDRKDGFRFLTVYYDSTFGFWLPGGEDQLYPEPSYSSFEGFDFDSNYVYIAHGQFGIEIYDVDYFPGGTNDIIAIGSVDTPGSALDVAHTADGKYLAVADNQAGLQIVDITDRTAPVVVGQLLPDRVNEAFKVWVQGDTAYFMDKYNGIFAADISIREQPRLIAYYDTPRPNGFFVSSDHTIFLADKDMGLYILRWN